MTVKRVGVIESVDNDTKIVQFLGYGTYLGDFPQTEGLDDFGLDDMEINVPTIKMDNGCTIYGTNVSFWASDESIQESFREFKGKGYTINHVVL
jgi:hypothetical protein